MNGTLGTYDERIRVLGNDLQVGEPDMVQHAETAGAVEQPEHGQIEQFVVASRPQAVRTEARPWRALNCGLFIDMCLEEKTPRANAADSFERELGVFQMIKDTIEENEVESAKALWFKIIDIHQERGRIGLPGVFNDVKAAYGFGIRVDADDFAGSSPFRLKREKAFRASDVQDAHAGEIFR